MTAGVVGVFVLGMMVGYAWFARVNLWEPKPKREIVSCPICGERRDAEDLWPWIENNVGRSCRKCGANLAVAAESSEHFKAKRAEQQRVDRLRAEAKAYNEAIEKGDES